MRSFYRITKFAFQDMVRNLGMSFMTVLILVLMLLSVNTLVAIRVLTTEATESVRSQLDISVFFDPLASDEQIDEVREYIELFPEISESTFLTRQEVLDQFRENHKDNPDIIASLDELDENPLGPTLIVQTDDPNDYQKIIRALDIPEYESVIDAKTFADTEEAISKIEHITSQVERLSILLAALFGIIAFFIIFNTVRVAIYTQRIEISIKKLVGATNWFIRGPYVIEAFVFAAISVAITYILVMLAVPAIDPYVTVIFGTPDLLTTFFSSNILMLFGLEFLAVLLLTILSSTLAMRRYLRV